MAKDAPAAPAPAPFTKLSDEQAQQLRELPMELAIRFWDGFEAAGRKFGEQSLRVAIRALVMADLFYLLVRVCKRVDMLHPWIYARCREVEGAPNGYVDLWARGHYKTTVGLGLIMQDVLKDPETTQGIFSHTRPIAKAFLRQIMREFESNKVLHMAFPDVLVGEDTKKYQKWSEDDGIIVKRKGNPIESTVEAWGLIDGQPVSKHFKVLNYDDIVVQASVTNPEMIEKTMTGLEQSYNLIAEDGVKRMRGTRWNFNDAHRTVIDRGTFIAREHPGRERGSEEGRSVYWPEKVHAEKRRDMGPFTYAAQILLNPKADNLQGFRREWMRNYTTMHGKTNNYILVDAASSKKKGSDYTAMIVVGLATDGNYYILDMVRDRLSLTERAERLFALHRKWKPKQVRYEKYGLMADIEHIKSRQELETYRFDITEVAGITKKIDRIGRLIPIFEQGQMYLPNSLHRTDYQKKTVDLVTAFVEEEYAPFPVGLHDDMLDALARIAEPDLKLVWPKEEKMVIDAPRFRPQFAETGWMA